MKATEDHGGDNCVVGVVVVVGVDRYYYEGAENDASGEERHLSKEAMPIEGGSGTLVTETILPVDDYDYDS